MSVLSRRGDSLHIEELALSDIASQFGTPLYVYSCNEIRERFLAYQNALGDHPGRIYYAVKANSNLAILQVLATLGAGFDIVSSGELMRVLLAGGDPKKIVFSGVAKSRDEMAQALEAGIACFNVESARELEVLAEVAADKGCIAPISIRVNPDVDAKTHPYISTGLKENKFGVAIDDAPALYARAAALSSLEVVGVDCHIGSQLTENAPFLDALDRLLALIDQLKAEGIAIRHLDLGGGLGIAYRDETPPSIGDYVAKLKSALGDRALELSFEPGRSIVGNAGVLLTQVRYLKPGEHKNFAIIDAAMNDNIRPALYQAWQDIQPVSTRSDVPVQTWDLVGPVCETADFLGKNRELALREGDTLAMLSSGAYCFAMASNYNSRGRAAEVLVDGNQVFLIRERESFDTIVAGEHLLPDGVS